MAKAATQMSLLGALKFTNEKKPGPQAAKADPVKKFAESLDAQLVYVEKELKGETLPTTNGGKMPKRIYWKKNGVFFVSLQYGNAALDVGGNSVVEAGKTLEDVRKVINTLKEYAKNEDETLVDAINKAAADVSARLKNSRGKGKAA